MRRGRDRWVHTPAGAVFAAAWHRCRSSPLAPAEPDVDLPADTVLVGDGTESVAPELLGQRNPDRAAVGQAVEDGPQPRLIGADNRQFHPGLQVQGGVVAVAGPQGYIAAQ